MIACFRGIYNAIPYIVDAESLEKPLIIALLLI